MIKNILNCLKFLKARLKEKSTYQGFVYLSAFFGLSYGAEIFFQIESLVTGVSLLLGAGTAIWQMFSKEK